MAKKIFGVYLAKLDAPNSEANARLELPASLWELHDAMDKVQLQENEELYLEVDDYYAFEYLAPHLVELDASLNELNDLAGQLAVLDETEQEVFDGLLRLEIQRKVKSNAGILTMQNLRDLAVSAGADCCHVVGATSDAELGRFYAENGFILNAMEGHPHRTDGAYCSVPVSHRVTLGKIVRLLQTFHDQPQTLLLPEIPEGSFAKKLYSTYLSYLPPEKIAFPLKMNVDERGSFTELLKTKSCGQVSVNITKPGITKGQHWHNSKWEFFMVVAGHGLIQERKIGSDEKIEFEVCGDRIQAVHMLPGYTHNIINLSETENLVTVMWANEQFDPGRPDTYFEEV